MGSAAKTNGAGIGGLIITPANPDPNVKYSDIWFVYNLDKGESKKDAVKIKNNTGKDVEIKIYPVDAGLTPDGAFALNNEGDEKIGVGKWIKMEDIEDYKLTIPDKAERLVYFTISIPQDAETGDHMGGIIIENLERQKGGKEGNISIVTRVGVRVYETVPGELIKKIELTGFEFAIHNKPLTDKSTTWEKIKHILGIHKYGEFNIGLKNTGNVHLDPIATIEIRDIFGGHIDTLENFALGSTFPGRSTLLPRRWENPSWFNFAKAHLLIKYGDNQTIEKNISFFIVPWPLIFLIVVLIILFFLCRLLWRLWLAKAKLKMETYIVKKNQTIMDIAEKYGVSWKKLARINNLKPPYTLKQEEIIFIPKKK
jgi:nucleoid-associated protein YgaU